MAKLDGTTVICPDCGDGIELTITLGPTERHEGEVRVAVGFDEEDFRQRFEQHVLADPLGHPRFVSPTDSSGFLPGGDA